MDSRVYNVGNIFDPRPPENMDELRASIGFDLTIYLADNMVALSNDDMIDSELFRLFLTCLHLPSARTADDNLRLWRALASSIYPRR